MSGPAITFAIGDIHGCYNKLLRLLKTCLQHADGRIARYVFIGDYIDRGPDSKAVVELLMAVETRNPSLCVCLKGNHEQMLTDASASERSLQHWLANGGDTTLASYGSEPDLSAIADHLPWLAERPLFYDDDARFFVHAGLDPDRALRDQTAHAMLWMREPFLSSDHDFGRMVVHGHTPTRGMPEIRSNRVNLDTGAVFGGPLTAAVFEDLAPRPSTFLAAR